MLQEMKLEDALKKFLQGKKVLVMYDESLKNDGTEFIVEALEKNVGEKPLPGGCACHRGF